METRRKEDVLILAPQGNLVGKSETAEFERSFAEAVSRGDKFVIVDLTGVRHANSTGLGALVAAHLKAREVGARMVLVNVSRRISDVLEVTRLTSVFLIADSEDAALQMVKS